MLNLLKYNIQAPRYTSYPTAHYWENLSHLSYQENLIKVTEEPLSLYVHIPFCKTMCLFCGCSVILNRRPENEEIYTNYLIKEIELVSSYLSLPKKKITQLHFGGGTPTKLSEEQLSKIMGALHTHFSLEAHAEIAIEVDPRTVYADHGQKLTLLKKLGFNRISFGVQDTHPQVQAAIKRHQTLEMTKTTFSLAKDLGFKGINIDLIYGLPFQTPLSFQKTISDILELGPDRIALFSYAKIPWLKKHQQAICDKDLPITEEKLQIYDHARKNLVSNGYVAIGMDHFAKEEDELAISYRTKNLQRNFQGYTVKRAEGLIGLGLSSIGNLSDLYVQNHKTLESYYQTLDQGILPVVKGKKLSHEDLLRRWVIHTMMCHFELDKMLFFQRFEKNFDEYFLSLKAIFTELESEGLLKNKPEKLEVTVLGELFIRNIVLHFDAYLEKGKMLYSYSV